MHTLEQQFVPYPLAKEVRKKGFNRPCFAKYTKIPEDNIDWFTIPEQGLSNGKQLFGGCKNYNAPIYKREDCISAPTWQQVVDWLREEHNLYIGTPLRDDGDYNPLVKNVKTGICLFNNDNSYPYYEALTIAIEEALLLI